MAWELYTGLFTDTSKSEILPAGITVNDVYTDTYKSAYNYSPSSTGIFNVSNWLRSEGRTGTFRKNLKDGAYAEIQIDEPNFKQYSLRDKNGNYVVGISTSMFYSNMGLYIGFIINHENQYAIAFKLQGSNLNAIDLSRITTPNSSTSMRNLYNFIMDNELILSDYVSLENVIGIDSTVTFTKLKDDFTFHGNATPNRPISDVVNYNANSNVDVLYNTSTTSERRIVTTLKVVAEGIPLSDAYDENYITIKRVSIDGLENVVLTAHKYRWDGTTDFADFIIRKSTDTSRYTNYLCLLLDDTHERAMFSTEIYDSVTNLTAHNMNVLVNPPTENDLHVLWEVLQDRIIPLDDEPFEGETSTGDDGTGDNNYIDEPLDADTVPPAFVLESGFITLYAPTKSQLETLSRYMWTNDLFDVANFKKIFANPMDCILSLIKFPYNVVGESVQELAVGNIGTGVNLTVASEQFHDILMGAQYVEAQKNSFLDISPYTRISIYLPFCGTYALNADEVAGHNVYLKYRVDQLTGACVAQVRVDGYDGKLIGCYNGNMAYNIPLTNLNYNNAMQSLVNIPSQILSFGTAIAGGAINPFGAISNTLSGMNSGIHTSVEANKPRIETTGNVQSNLGACSYLKPYILLECPNVSEPAENMRNLTMGTPSNVTATLSACSGFTKVLDMHLSIPTATETEQKEVERLLKEGVIF